MKPVAEIEPEAPLKPLWEPPSATPVGLREYVAKHMPPEVQQRLLTATNALSAGIAPAIERLRAEDDAIVGGLTRLRTENEQLGTTLASAVTELVEATARMFPYVPPRLWRRLVCVHPSRPARRRAGTAG